MQACPPDFFPAAHLISFQLMPEAAASRLGAGAIDESPLDRPACNPGSRTDAGQFRNSAEVSPRMAVGKELVVLLDCRHGCPSVADRGFRHPTPVRCICAGRRGSGRPGGGVWCGLGRRIGAVRARAGRARRRARLRDHHVDDRGARSPGPPGCAPSRRLDVPERASDHYRAGGRDCRRGALRARRRVEGRCGAGRRKAQSRARHRHLRRFGRGVTDADLRRRVRQPDRESRRGGGAPMQPTPRWPSLRSRCRPDSW